MHIWPDLFGCSCIVPSIMMSITCRLQQRFCANSQAQVFISLYLSKFVIRSATHLTTFCWSVWVQTSFFSFALVMAPLIPYHILKKFEHCTLECAVQSVWCHVWSQVKKLVSNVKSRIHGEVRTAGSKTLARGCPAYILVAAIDRLPS